MKIKLIITIMAIIFSINTANAAINKVNVEAVSDFSTKNPVEEIDVKVVKDSKIGTYELHAGDVIHCKVLKVIPPKIGKRAASFNVSPLSYTSEGQTTVINEQFSGKYFKKVLSKETIKTMDKKKAGIKAATTVGGFFVKGVAPAVSLAEGMIINEDGNRLESGVKQVYKDSPLSFLEKGKYVELKSGEEFNLFFKQLKNKKSSKEKDNDESNESNEINDTNADIQAEEVL